MLVDISPIRDNVIKLSTGIYQTHWFTLRMYTKQRLEEFFTLDLPPRATRDTYGNLHETSTYGVCDSVENFLEVYGDLADGDTKYAVSLTKVSRDDEPEEDGWRWCKWGPYIGKYKPTKQYLYDEPDIESVYCYQICKVID